MIIRWKNKLFRFSTVFSKAERTSCCVFFFSSHRGTGMGPRGSVYIRYGGTNPWSGRSRHTNGKGVDGMYPSGRQSGPADGKPKTSDVARRVAEISSW